MLLRWFNQFNSCEIPIKSYEIPINSIEFPLQSPQKKNKHKKLWIQKWNLYKIPPKIIKLLRYLPFYSLFVIFWGVAFLRSWDRQCSEAAWRWNVHGVECRRPTVKPRWKSRENPVFFRGKPWKTHVFFQGKHERTMLWLYFNWPYE